MTRRNAIRVNAIAIAELMLGLQDGCHTMQELSDMCGLSIQTVRNYCKQLHKRSLVHIVDWREDKHGGRTLRVYELGEGIDVKRPAPRSRAEACAKWRAKQKAAKMLQRMAANGSQYQEAA